MTWLFPIFVADYL